MAFQDLRDFLHKLEREHELRRISAEVDPVLEIAEITDRGVKAGAPALLLGFGAGMCYAAQVITVP